MDDRWLVGLAMACAAAILYRRWRPRPQPGPPGCGQCTYAAQSPPKNLRSPGAAP